MALTGSLNQMAVLGQYDVKVGNHGHATVSVLDFDGAEWLYAHGEGNHGQRIWVSAMARRRTGVRI